MKAQMEEMLSKITEFIRNEARTETVIGKSFKLGEFEIVPVIRLGLGFGSVAGEGGPNNNHGVGEGGGGGLGIEPIGFLAAHNQEITFIPSRVSKGISAAFEKLPEVIEKYMEMQKAKEVVN